jgi:PAS domain-containing protein
MIKDQLKLLETLLEHIPYGVYLYELEEPEEVSSLRLIATNSAATKFTGIKAEKIVGRKIFDAFPGLRRAEQSTLARFPTVTSAFPNPYMKQKQFPSPKFVLQ